MSKPFGIKAISPEQEHKELKMGVLEERRKTYIPGVVRPLISRFKIKLGDYSDCPTPADVAARAALGLVYAQVTSYVAELSAEHKGKVAECGWGHAELGPYGSPRGVSMREAARYTNPEDHINLNRSGFLNLDELVTLTLLAGIADYIWAELQKKKR